MRARGHIEQRLALRRLAWITVLITTLLALMAAELGLRYLDRVPVISEHMDPGLIRYDAELGWRLSPDWHGHHRHTDYQATYTTDDRGRRVTLGRPGPGAGDRAVFGDSFTFGLGVDDGQTFVDELNRNASSDHHYLNLGVPGYSTDQEYLYMQEVMPQLRPQRVVLVVYLANDLFDNALDYPLQAAYAKPRFQSNVRGELLLLNTPVPRTPKPAAQQALDSKRLLYGSPGDSWLDWPSRHSALVRRLAQLFRSHPTEDAGLQGRLQPYLELFDVLLAHIQASLRESSTDLSLVLLPGRSLIERPGSYSAAYQEVLRQAIVTAHGSDTDIIDLTPRLQQAASTATGPLYYPHDGHLTVLGHQLVARWLAEALEGKSR